jgi:3-oxoacyl-[acyl-carrier protein] reductase
MDPDVHGAVEALLDEVGTETQPRAIFDATNLRGQVAIVTGGSSGIGRAVALELAQCGVHIAFCFLDSGAQARLDAQDVARKLREMEVRTYFRSCDVRDSRDVKDFVGEVQEELGGVQILINNAGIGRDGALWRMGDHEWEAVVRTNLDGAFFFTREVAPCMRAQEYGKIVNVTSVHGLRSEFGISNYASSKAGLIGLTRSAAVELGPRNINVNAVAPGYIRTTRLTDGVSPEILDRARENAPLGRLGDPQDVAGVVLFLCSESARHMTGVVIPVDGGYLL